MDCVDGTDRQTDMFSAQCNLLVQWPHDAVFTGEIKRSTITHKSNNIAISDVGFIHSSSLKNEKSRDYLRRYLVNQELRYFNVVVKSSQMQSCVSIIFLLIDKPRSRQLWQQDFHRTTATIKNTKTMTNRMCTEAQSSKQELIIIIINNNNNRSYEVPYGCRWFAGALWRPPASPGCG